MNMDKINNKLKCFGRSICRVRGASTRWLCVGWFNLRVRGAGTRWFDPLNSSCPPRGEGGPPPFLSLELPSLLLPLSPPSAGVQVAPAANFLSPRARRRIWAPSSWRRSGSMAWVPWAGCPRCGGAFVGRRATWWCRWLAASARPRPSPIWAPSRLTRAG
jgi:hypothetical protein